MHYHQIHSERLLEKLMQMQSDLLSKKALPSLVKSNKDFFLDFVNAEFIGISLKGRDSFFEFTCKIGEDHGLIQLMQDAQPKTEALITKLKLSEQEFAALDIGTLCEFFDPEFYLCEDIKAVMDGKKIIISRLHHSQHTNPSEATVLIILHAENYHEANIQKGYEVANLLWELIVPFYDYKSGTIYQSCLHETFYFDHLSEREQEVARGLSHGRSQAEIAKELSLSINTIKTHIKSIYRKFGVNSRIEFISNTFKR